MGMLTLKDLIKKTPGNVAGTGPLIKKRATKPGKPTKAGKPRKIENPRSGGTKESVNVVTTKAVLDIDEYGLHKKVLITSIADTDPRFSIIKFYGIKDADFYDPKNFNSLDSRVWVTCSCEFWLYFCEVAVAKKSGGHSTSILKSNGAEPITNNPGEIAFLCKHLYRGYPHALVAVPTESPRIKTLNKLLDREEECPKTVPDCAPDPKHLEVLRKQGIKV